MLLASNRPVSYWRRSGEDRFEQRQLNRGKWVKRGMIGFGALLVISIPFEFHEYAASTALSTKEVILRANELQLGSTPVVDYGPNGRVAVRLFGTGAWIKPAANHLCNTVGPWTGVVGHIKVGFLEANEGATAIVAASCQTTDGLSRLIVGRYRPSGVLAAIMLPSARQVTTATVIATPSTLYIKSPVYANRSASGKSSETVIGSL